MNSFTPRIILCILALMCLQTNIATAEDQALLPEDCPSVETHIKRKMDTYGLNEQERQTITPMLKDMHLACENFELQKASDTINAIHTKLNSYRVSIQSEACTVQAEALSERLETLPLTPSQEKYYTLDLQKAFDLCRSTNPEQGYIQIDTVLEKLKNNKLLEPAQDVP